MELAQIVIFRELSGPDDRMWYDKTRPYNRLTEKLVWTRERYRLFSAISLFLLIFRLSGFLCASFCLMMLTASSLSAVGVTLSYPISTTGSLRHDRVPAPCITELRAGTGLVFDNGRASVFGCGWILGKSLLVMSRHTREPAGNT